MGNRTTYTVTLGSTAAITHTYDAANRLTAAGDVAYAWDARGNLVDDGTFTYTYNAAGRLVGAQGLTATLVYTYTADGLRVAQSMDGEVTEFAWDWATGVPEMLSEGGNLYLAGHDTLGKWDGSVWAYYLPDALGSARQAVDSTGQAVSSREWTPYGVEMGVAQAGLGYTGEWWDAAAGLLYLRARWYAAGVGIFTTPDTVSPGYRQPQGIDRYVYVLGNPLRHRDPSGKCASDDTACIIRRNLVREYAEYLAHNRGLLGLDDIDILANTCDYAATFYEDGNNDSVQDFVNDTGSIFVGLENDDYMALLQGHGDATFILRERLGDIGYRKRYQDDDDQAHHFWFYVQLGAMPAGKVWSWAGNLAHETVFFSAPEGKRLFEMLPCAGDRFAERIPIGKPWDLQGKVSTQPPYVSLGYGRSITDLLLGRQGGNLGKELTEGIVNFSEVGDWVRRTLGTGTSLDRPRVSNPFGDV